MKKLLVNVLLVFGISFGAKPAWAILIEFQPAAQMVEVGDSLGVDIVVSGLSDAREIVSAYNLDVTYDASVLTATGVTLGLFLGSDPSCFDLPLPPCSFTLTTPGVVNLAEVSLLGDAELADLQSDSVILATLLFDALAEGMSTLDFLSFDELGIDVTGRAIDLEPQRLQFSDVGTGTVTVGVPEPGTLWLLVTGLVLIVFSWRHDIRRRVAPRHPH